MGGPAGWYRGRCKDCSANAIEGLQRCEDCRAAHNAREAERRAERRDAAKCWVCGQRAVVVNGQALSTCKIHREYFAARARGEETA